MTQRVLGPSGSKRRRTRLLVLTALTGALLTVFFVGASSALNPGKFEGGDGNLVVNTSGNNDWCNDLLRTSGNCASPFPGLHTGTELATGTGDNSFGQGTKEDDANVTAVTGSIPPNKSDLTRFYEATELANNKVLLYLAWERSNVLGSANMDFEINAQGSTACPPGTFAGKSSDCTITRVNGDILVTFDFGGSGAPDLALLRWLTVGGTNPYDASKTNAASDCYSANALPCWGDRKALTSSNSEGAVNTTDNNPTTGAVYEPFLGTTLPAETFGEAAINLTDTGVITSSTGCNFSRATTFLKSRASSSFPAEVKDYIAPVQTPVISNCGALLIKKESTKTGNPLVGVAGATFCYKISPATTCTSSDTTVTDDNTAAAPDEDATVGEVCVSGLAPGSYVVNETAAPSGYGGASETDVSVTVTNGTDCGTHKPTTAATGLAVFTNPPLSKIEVKFLRVGSQTETNASIVCKDASNNVLSAQPENLTADPAFDDTDETFGNGTSGLVPGTYNCQVVIDP